MGGEVATIHWLPLKHARVSSLVNSNKHRFGNGMPACFAFDFTTGRCAADGQMIDRQREQPKLIMVHPVAARRTWTAVAGALKIIDCLLESEFRAIACGALGKRRQARWNVVSCPMMPSAGGRVGIIA